MLTCRCIYRLALIAVFAAGCVNAPHVGGPGGGDSDGGSSSSPGHIKACLFDGDTELACSESAGGLVAALSSEPVGLGVTLRRKVKLIGEGPGVVTVTSFTATASPDLTLAPTSSDFHGVTLASGEAVAFDVAITPTVGGPASATITIQTTDPENPTLVVTLDWMGDGPALCMCLRESEGSAKCDPTTAVDFGAVGVGLSANRFMRWASCGTQPVTFKTAEVVNAGSPASFWASGLPPAGSTLDPSDDPIDVVLNFLPTQPRPYAGPDGGGRLRIETSNQRIVVNLSGTGREGGCRLQAATPVLDFGQGGINVVTQRILALSNYGSEDCTFPTPASITKGQNIRFDVVNAPSFPLAPGQTSRVTLMYLPQDAVGPDTGEVSIPYGSATGNGTLTVALKGTPVRVPVCQLEIQPATNPGANRFLDFGAVASSTTKVLSVTLKNVGSKSCAISKTSLVPGTWAGPLSPPLTDFRILTMPTASLAPGSSTVVDISYTPSLINTTPPPNGSPRYGGNLVIQTDDARFSGQDCAVLVPGTMAVPGCLTWMLLGWGALRQWRFVPERVDFGTVSAGCLPVETSVRIYNTGAIPIQLSSLGIDPVTQPPIFSVVPEPLPIVVNPGTSHAIRLRYAPPDANPHTAGLFMSIEGSLTSLDVIGRGTTDTHRTDAFQRSVAPKTDVLFVVSDAPSMAHEHNLLTSRGQVFLDEADRLGADYQIAVVTTNMDLPGQSGVFQGAPRIITRSSSAVSQFMNTITALGLANTGNSQGLEAMFHALTSPLINDPLKNGGFLRPDAQLAVILVSDREDASHATTAFYADFLENVTGARRQSMVSLSAIAGDVPNGCTNTTGWASAAFRDQAVQLATGGEFHSSCTYDWTPIVQALGERVFAAPSAFTLSAWADASTILVSVGGVVSRSTDWTYDAATNTVAFVPSAIPPVGVSIVVDYDTLCR